MYYPGDQVASGQFYGALFTVAGVTMFLVAAPWLKVPRGPIVVPFWDYLIGFYI